jgi:hypothetical protein
MTVGIGRQARRPASEEAVAATRVVLALTAAVGGMAGGIGIVGQQPMAWVAAPVIGLLVAGLMRSTRIAAAFGAVIWAALLPGAHAEGMLGPLLMTLACIAIAVGPERLAGWAARDFRGRRAPERPVEAGWIEEV